jgi:predicted phosphoribosyltransferase
MDVAREPRDPIPYRDRRHAGVVLAQNLEHYRGRTDLAVLALPRGGVPVADEVARALNAPLDIFVVRKLGAPGQEELAMGAIASGGVRVLNDDTIKWYGLSPAVIDQVAQRELAELARREEVYRQGRPLIPVSDRTVILVDDGLATGATMQAAALAARRLSPARVVVAVPVGAAESCAALSAIADEVVCPMIPTSLTAVGLWYEDFSQTSDEEVRGILDARLHAETGGAIDC